VRDQPHAAPAEAREVVGEEAFEAGADESHAR
jgi:hypothetical protein